MKNNKTKLLLFETALSLFREKGYENVSIAEICEAAGTTRNAFYYHYTSKEDLLCHYAKYSSQLETHIMEGIFKQPDDWEKLLFLFESHVRMIVQEGADITRQLFISSLVSGKGILDHYEVTTNLCLPLIEQCKKSGLITLSLDAEELNYIATRLVMSIVQDWSINGGTYDVVQKVRQILTDLLRPGCGKSAE